MLIKEQISTNVIRYYSDSGKYIRRIEDGRLFKEREDVVNGKWTYEETNFDINPKTEDEDQNEIKEVK